MRTRMQLDMGAMIKPEIWPGMETGSEKLGILDYMEYWEGIWDIIRCENGMYKLEPIKNWNGS